MNPVQIKKSYPMMCNFCRKVVILIQCMSLAFFIHKNLCSHLLFFLLQLNAWDPKRVEEPDYLRRLAGFREVNSVIKSMTTLDSQFLHAVLMNSCFFIKSVSIIVFVLPFILP